jgi:hypothetical protein
LLARTQLGLFTHEQAIACGFPRETIRRRVMSGVWERVDRPVLRVAATAPVDERTALLARTLATDGIACDLSAASLHELHEHETAPTVLVRRGARAANRVGVRATATLDPIDVTTVDGIATTAVARTIIDVARFLPRPELENILDRALVTQAVRRHRLEARARALWTPRRSGCAIVLALLGERIPGLDRTRSVWEANLVRMFQAADAPPPDVNLPVRVGGRMRVLDLAWPILKVGVEFDGFVPHSSRRAFDDDRARQNDLVADGWRVFRLTSTALQRDPSRAIAPILAAVMP